jgi:hypothetical protein
MVLSTMAAPGNIKILSTDASSSSYPVTVRLRGRWDDVRAVVGHWGIDVEWEEAVSRIREECAVDGMLNMKD